MFECPGFALGRLSGQQHSPGGWRITEVDLAQEERAGEHEVSIRAPPKEPTIQGRALALRGKLEDKSITHLQLLFAECR